MLGSRKQNPNQAKKLADVQIAKKDESKQAKEDELRQTIINFFKIYSDNHHPDGYIQENDFYEILKRLGFPNDNHIIFITKQQMMLCQVSRIDMKFTESMVSLLKEIQSQQNKDTQQDQFEECFQALGGGPGTDGSIDKDHLVNILVEQFGIQYDIRGLLDKIEKDHDEIDYKSFCAIFSDDNLDNDDIQSILSYSVISYIQKKNSTGQKKFKVKYSEFEKFYKKTQES